MSKILQVFVFIIFFVNSAFAAEKPADYAYGMALEATGSEAFYDVTLPPTVYRGVTRGNLADVRVFNGAGEIVPHAWRPRRTASADAPAPVALTLFPLKAPAGASLESMSIKVRRGAGGSVSVDVQSSGFGAAASYATAGYFVDVGNQERVLRAIEFDWKPTDGFTGKLRIDASDNLASWRTLVAGAPLVSLEVAGQRLQQKRVELPPQKSKYLRIAWVAEPGARAMPELTSASAELAEKFVEAPREWMKFDAAKGEKAGEYTFDTRGRFPADRLRIDLPDVNTIAQVELFARNRAEEPWRTITRGVIYRLRQSSGEIVSPELAAIAASERYWLLRVDQRGGGLGSGMPALNVGWVPHQLVFAARGAPPFQMAYGNRDAKPAAYAIETLLPGYRDDAGVKVRAAKTGTQTVNVSAAGTQSQKELGGESRLADATDWKRWSLWGALALGVLILGAMAWRLMKQLGGNRKDEG